MTIATAVSDFLEWKKTHMDSPAAYQGALRPLILSCGNVETDAVNIHHITEIVKSLTEAGKKTFYFLTVLKVFARFCFYSKIPFVNPELIRPHRVEDPTEIPHLTEEDISMMCDSLDDDTFLGIRDQLIIRLLFDTGMRLSELLSFTVPYFLQAEKDGEETNCAKVMTRKSKRYRYVAWSLETHQLFQTYFAMRISKDWKTDAFFINRLGHKLTPRGVEYMFSRVSKDVMGEARHPHECRHGKMFSMMEDRHEKGIPSPQEAATVLGHKNLQSIMTYFRVTARESLKYAKRYL